jgi:hypothetical protein
MAYKLLTWVTLIGLIIITLVQQFTIDALNYNLVQFKHNAKEWHAYIHNPCTGGRQSTMYVSPLCKTLIQLQEKQEYLLFMIVQPKEKRNETDHPFHE